MEAPLVELNQDPINLMNNSVESTTVNQASTPESDVSSNQDANPQCDQDSSSSVESQQQENEIQKQSTNTPSTASQEDENSSNKENIGEAKETSSIKESLGAGISGDTQIAQILEKLIKERDRLNELGILMNQQNKQSSKRPALVSAEHKENVGPISQKENCEVQNSSPKKQNVVVTGKHSNEQTANDEQGKENQQNPQAPQEAINSQKSRELRNSNEQNNEIEESNSSAVEEQQEKEQKIENPVNNNVEDQENQEPQLIEEEEQQQHQEEEVVENDETEVAEEGQLRAQIHSGLPRTNIKKLRCMELKDLIHISKKSVNYGPNLPGQISEEPLEIVNKSNENLVVEILIDCLNTDLQDTDEYVYSIRRSHAYDYNDKHYLIMAPYSSASFRLALKVPSMRFRDQIKGEARVSIQGLSESFAISMVSCVSIPKVFCPRELYNKNFGRNIIKLAMKQGKKLENKVPFKNTGSVPLTIDFEFHKPAEKFNSKFDCFIYPTAITIPAGGLAVANVMLKFVGGPNAKDTKDLLKRVLIGKVRDSAVIYTFYLYIETY